MFKAIHKAILQLLVALVFLFNTSPIAQAENAGLDAEQNMLRLYDWILYIDVDTVDNFLKYNQSKLTPLTRLKVTYQETVARYTLRGVSAELPKPIKNEEFWYHFGLPVGLRRVNRIPVRSDMQGALYFRSYKVNGIFDNTASIANCIARLLLEVNLERSILAAVLIPDSSFDKVASELGRFNFFPVTVNSRGSNLTIRLISYPQGDEQDFYFSSH